MGFFKKLFGGGSDEVVVETATTSTEPAEASVDSESAAKSCPKCKVVCNADNTCPVCGVSCAVSTTDTTETEG